MLDEIVSMYNQQNMHKIHTSQDLSASVIMVLSIMYWLKLQMQQKEFKVLIQIYTDK